MDLQPISSKVILDGYQKNGEWDLQKTKAVRGSVFHAFSNTSEFTEMSYKLLLRRKPLYYVANFLIPCVLIALITILLFLIPAGMSFKIITIDDCAKDGGEEFLTKM